MDFSKKKLNLLFLLGEEGGGGQVAIQLWKSRNIFHYQQICVSLVFFNDRKLIIPSSRVCDDSLNSKCEKRWLGLAGMWALAGGQFGWKAAESGGDRGGIPRDRSWIAVHVEGAQIFSNAALRPRPGRAGNLIWMFIWCRTDYGTDKMYLS